MQHDGALGALSALTRPCSGQKSNKVLCCGHVGRTTELQQFCCPLRQGLKLIDWAVNEWCPVQHYGAQAVVVSIDPRRVWVSDGSSCPHQTIHSQHRGPQGEERCWWQCTGNPISAFDAWTHGHALKFSCPLRLWASQRIHRMVPGAVRCV